MLRDNGHSLESELRAALEEALDPEQQQPGSLFRDGSEGTNVPHRDDDKSQTEYVNSVLSQILAGQHLGTKQEGQPFQGSEGANESVARSDVGFGQGENLDGAPADWCFVQPVDADHDMDMGQ